MSGEELCSLLVADMGDDVPKESDLMKSLETGDVQQKISTIKTVIAHTVAGHSFPRLLMSVIKFALHSTDHVLKKLLYLYWEVVQKKGADGTLLPEMILVCNAMKKDLQHPNEYIKGSTLRFLCKMKEREILESLIPPITANLEHRHSYVRKNAVLTVFTIWQSFPDLIEDCGELIEAFLMVEANPAAKRNAFLMLYACDEERCMAFLDGSVNTVASSGEAFQLAVLDVIRRVCRKDQSARARYIRAIHTLVHSNSNAVAFEGAATLVSLSSKPTAVRAAVSTYCRLLQSESDNTVKLVILGHLDRLAQRNKNILQELLMDILRTLSSPSIDIRRKTLELALRLVTGRSAEAVVLLLKKEMSKLESKSGQATGVKTEQYRQLLVDTLHKFSVKFPEVVGSVVTLLLQYLGHDDPKASLEVILFIREVAAQYPHLRANIISKLIESFDDIKSPAVYRITLWILGQYADERALLDLSLSALMEAMEPLPLVITPPTPEEAEAKALAEGQETARLLAEKDAKQRAAASKPKMNADGSYAMQANTSAVDVSIQNTQVTADGGDPTSLRAFIVAGDFLLATSLCVALTKLVLRSQQLHDVSQKQNNVDTARVMLLCSCILRYGRSDQSKTRMDEDVLLRLSGCISVLMDESNNAKTAFCKNGEATFLAMLEADAEKRALKEVKKDAQNAVKAQVDDVLSMRQLTSTVNTTDFDFVEDEDLGATAPKKPQEKYAQLQRVYQLTGFADPVYVEARLNVLEYDVVLEILVINQTNKTLQNVNVELFTNGDLKVLQHQTPFVLEPHGLHRTSVNIKVTSTESCVVFGNLVFDIGVQQSIVVLNHIRLAIIDYILPAHTTDAEFRSMWADFEWENKLAVITDMSSLADYLNHVMSVTHMASMTPVHTLTQEADQMFLAANLYARSMFGEDALLNLSIERTPKGKIRGYIRIRSKTQGIALSLGEKITAQQKTQETEEAKTKIAAEEEKSSMQ